MTRFEEFLLLRYFFMEKEKKSKKQNEKLRACNHNVRQMMV